MIQIKITIKINNYMLLYFSRERESCYQKEVILAIFPLHDLISIIAN